MTGRRLLILSAIAGPVAAGLAYLAGGPIALAAAAVALLLLLVARVDNHTGSCLMLTILGLLVVLVMMFLIALMALRR